MKTKEKIQKNYSQKREILQSFSVVRNGFKEMPIVSDDGFWKLYKIETFKENRFFFLNNKQTKFTNCFWFKIISIIIIIVCIYDIYTQNKEYEKKN